MRQIFCKADRNLPRKDHAKPAQTIRRSDHSPAMQRAKPPFQMQRHGRPLRPQANRSRPEVHRPSDCHNGNKYNLSGRRLKLARPPPSTRSYKSNWQRSASRSAGHWAKAAARPHVQIPFRSIVWSYNIRYSMSEPRAWAGRTNSRSNRRSCPSGIGHILTQLFSLSG